MTLPKSGLKVKIEQVKFTVTKWKLVVEARNDVTHFFSLSVEFFCGKVVIATASEGFYFKNSSFEVKIYKIFVASPSAHVYFARGCGGEVL